MAVAHHLAEVGDLADIPEQANRAWMGGEPHQPRGCATRAGSARWSSASRIWKRPGRGRPPRRGCRAMTPDRCEAQSRVAPGNIPGGSNRCSSKMGGVTMAGSSDLSSAVPCQMRRRSAWRPARPAIWAISAGDKRRGPNPSNLARRAKATWSRSGVEPPCRSHRWRRGNDFAGLEHADLRIARARAQGAQHHRSAAALAPHELGERGTWPAAGSSMAGCAAADASPSGGRCASRTERRGRLMYLGPRHECGAAEGPDLSAPRNIVSSSPRACRRRAVNTWPRSRSAQSWISSIARN